MFGVAIGRYALKNEDSLFNLTTFIGRVFETKGSRGLD